MRQPRCTGILKAVVFALGMVALLNTTSAAVTTFHTDHRDSPKLITEPTFNGAGLSGESLARAYIASRSTAFDVPSDLSTLRLASKRESLLGVHYRYQQQLDGIDVLRGEIVVSISKTTGRVYRAYNNVYPAKQNQYKTGARTQSVENAYDAAWNHLRVHGELTAAPDARLVWVPQGESFRLVWIVDLSVSAPYGGWEVRVDAVTGNVISTEDRNIYRVRDAFTEKTVSERIGEYTGPVKDRRAAFEAITTKIAAREGAARGTAANGTGVVFDPDPRTTLMDDNIQDGDPAGTFTAAYFTRNLLDITDNAGTWSLTGPWIDIVDFEAPNTPPSTTADGNWTATRGNNAFNDAMTYFHIDQNQRYMQSLGFTGATGIQEGQIDVDSDGFNGADNSYYSPSLNRMAFGHGCVDDNEDADVLLHEYGHAINHDINPSWSGGDTGAMGEGFGDYWAGSYSYSTPNGPTYHPEWIYSWDGHGTGNLCWPGRIMDALGALYVHTTFYSAHTTIPGGYVSDELWSTPLFQTLISLDGMGVPREEVDQIILEAQFGLGSGLKMRDMAEAIIQTADLLFPVGPHAAEFTAKFLVHDIVEVPAAVLVAADPVMVSAGGNGVPDPGETVTFQIDLTNTGTQGATGISATLSTTTPGVVINSGGSNYADIGIGLTESPATNYSLTVPGSHTCGDPVDLSLEVSFTGGVSSPVMLPITLGTGVPLGASESSSPALAIPDNNAIGVTDQIIVSGTGANVTANLNIDIDITHTWIGDLIVTLRSPMNTEVILHNRTGSSADDIVGNYPGTLTPAQSLAALIGEPLDGTWELTISDNAGLDTGTLNYWAVNDVSGYNCDAVSATATITPDPVIFDNAPVNVTTCDTIRVVNTGGATLNITNIVGCDVPPFELDTTMTSHSVAPGDSTEIVVCVTPVEAGPDTCLVTIYSDASNSPTDVSVQLGVVTSVAGGDTPSRFEITSVSPNPFNPSTTIHFFLPDAMPVTTEIWSVSGARVRVLTSNRRFGPGANQVAWDGRNDGGGVVASGVYFVRVKTPVGVQIARAVLLK